MPTNKVKAASVVGEYDVELMTAPELKAYVETLQEEHDRMRKAKNLYHKDKNELLNFLVCLQEKILDARQTSFQRNFETQQLSQELKTDEQLIKAKELELHAARERDRLDAFVRVKMAQIENREKEFELMKQVTEKEREIQNLRYVQELVSVEMEEGLLGKLMEGNRASSSDMEDRLVQHTKLFHQMLESFAQGKIEALHSLMGESQRNENTFADFLEKMGDYYKSLFWKNIKTIKDLANGLAKLKGDLTVLQLNLRDVVKSNQELEVSVPEPRSPLSPGSSRNEQCRAEARKVADMRYENHVMTIKLEMLNREYDGLKARFASAMRKVHQKADFKVMLLEKRLQAIRDTTDVTPP